MWTHCAGHSDDGTDLPTDQSSTPREDAPKDNQVKIPTMLDPLYENIKRALECLSELEAEGLIGAEKGKAIEDIKKELLVIKAAFEERQSATLKAINPEAFRKDGSLFDQLRDRSRDETPLMFNACPPFNEPRFSFASESSIESGWTDS